MPDPDRRAVLHVVVAWVVVVALLGCDAAEGLKVPFRVNDVLPVLPRQMSWPVLNNLHSAVDLLPYFVGSLTLSNASIKWKGACFYDNTANIELTPAFQGAVLYLKIIWLVSFLRMEGREGMSSGVTVIGAEAPSAYHMAPRSEAPSHGGPPAPEAPAGAIGVSPVSLGLDGTSVKKKRGRPRKYGPDGLVHMTLSPMPISSSAPFSTDFSSGKRGRPRGMDYKLPKKVGVDYLGGSDGTSFMPHIITVNSGEDIAMKEEVDEDDSDSIEKVLWHQPKGTAEDAERNNQSTEPVLMSHLFDSDIDWNEMEFLIKWKGQSHLHCQWKSFVELQNLSDFKKVLNYTKKIMEDMRCRRTISREEVNILVQLVNLDALIHFAACLTRLQICILSEISEGSSL